MTRPRSNQFATFFKALHGYDPLPWQRRLAATVIENGAWPRLLDIPTGLGKTSAIDVALFCLAARPDSSPRRIVVIVDRRVIVDQAAEHARKVQQRLTNAHTGVLGTVATALRSLWGGRDGRPPFEVSVLRGGMPRDEAWAHRPDRPVVVLSTVDQVGSRLLFRGYGVSANMAPIHAGLLGNDALLLLDEVQLSTAFAATLRALDERWRNWQEPHAEGNAHPELPNRWAFVRMSATPIGDEAGDFTFKLDDEDREHPVVRQRIGARKRAILGALIATTKDSDRSRRAVAEAFASHTATHLERGARRIAVIVNRVASARDIHEEVSARLSDRADVVLITGRMRPLDRDAILGAVDDRASIAGRISAGTPRDPESRPVIVVSTQTLEAGADFDFDALVTECASVDALRQRFGRLDRRGELGESHATILVRKDQASDSSDDPVYGAALNTTWKWLESKADRSGEVDFGIAHFPSLPKKREERRALCSPLAQAPVLLPAHLHAWAQTSPSGSPEPEVAPWLHGPARSTPEVRVVWRADLDDSVLRDPASAERLREYLAASLGVAPPSSLEAISIPLPAFIAWLESEDVADVVDVESAGAVPDPKQRVDRNTRPFVSVTSRGVEVVREPRQVRPESTVVVPSSYGGIRHGNWDPRAREPVADLGDVAQVLHRARPVLRLAPAVLLGPNDQGSASHATPSAATTASRRPEFALPRALVEAVPTAPPVEEPDFDATEAIDAWLESTRSSGSSLWRVVVDALLGEGRTRRLLTLGPSRFFAVVGRRVSRSTLEAYLNADPLTDVVADDDDGASYIGHEVELAEHLSDVERWARAFANNVGLPASVRDDIALAARLHDIGKADPRFQQMLHGGSAVRMAASGRLLAKSRADTRDRVAQRQARERARYPDGYRHELLSVAMLEGAGAVLGKAHDAELVLHLVGSHHGWCRPFAPAVSPGPSLDVSFALDGMAFSADTAHRLASYDSNVAERYWRLTERYGWWTLAWLEALLRLADHRASEEKAVGATKAQRTSQRRERRAESAS